MDTHRLEERGSQMFGGVESQVKSAEHRQRAARLTIRGGGQLWGISGALNSEVEVLVSAQTKKKAKCIHHVTDLKRAAPRTNTHAIEYIWCEGQRTIGGIPLSALHISRQNRHIGPCSCVVWDHRPQPWAFSKHPAGRHRYVTWCYLLLCLQDSDIKNNNIHLSHICRQQGLQFLHEKDTQGASWVEQLRERGLTD